MIEGTNKSTKGFFCKFLIKNKFPLSNIIDVGVENQTVQLRTYFKHIHQILIEPQTCLIPNIKKLYKDNNYTLLNIGASDIKTKPPDTNIEVDTLNNICGDLNKWLLLKIDVDGPELKVLDGADKILSKCAFVIIEAQLTKFHGICCRLHDANFSLFNIIEPRYLEDCMWQVDLIFINNEVKKQYPQFDIISLFRSGSRNFNKLF